MAGEDNPWYERAFRRRYLEVYAHRDDAAARREAAFVASLVGKAGPLLDAGCGAGRHARALVAGGLAVVGVDLSEDLLAEASKQGGGPRLVRADVRALPFRSGAFGSAASLFTTFGYFDDAANRTHLAEIRRVLAAGAPYVLDFLNAERVRATLVPSSEKTVAGLVISERRAIRSGRVEKDVEVRGGSGPVETWRESVRLYDRSELHALVGDAGFSVTNEFGDLSGGPWRPASARLVLALEAA